MLINPPDATGRLAPSPPFPDPTVSRHPSLTPSMHLNNSSYYIIYTSSAGTHVNRPVFLRTGRTKCSMSFVFYTYARVSPSLSCENVAHKPLCSLLSIREPFQFYSFLSPAAEEVIPSHQKHKGTTSER